MTSGSRRLVHVGVSILILFFVVSINCPSSGHAEDQPTVASAGSGTSPAVPAPSAAPESPVTYVIKEGDTLWDISGAHYRDPFLWPLIWKANPNITDPDLIYPGVSLIIPSLAPVERAMAEPEEAPVEKEAQTEPAPKPAPPQPSLFEKASAAPPATAEEPGSKLVLPKETTPPLLDKYGMISLGFIGPEPSKDTVLGGVADSAQKLMGYDDEIYVSIRSRQDVKVGDRFIIYRPDHEVKHPVTNRSYGPLNIVVGIAKVTETRENGNHTAHITLSFDSVEPGDLLMPYQEPELIYPSKEKRTKDLSGYVLETRDYRRINAQFNVIYLDKGKVDGVDPGDFFTIVTDGGSGSGTIKKIAKAQVFLVKDRTATAVINKSTETVGRGYRFQLSD